MNNDYKQNVTIDDLKQIIIDAIQEKQFQEAANGDLFQCFNKHKDKEIPIQVGSLCEFKANDNKIYQGTVESISKKKVHIKTTLGDTYYIPKHKVKTNLYTERLQLAYENYLDYIEDNSLYKKIYTSN